MISVDDAARLGSDIADDFLANERRTEEAKRDEAIALLNATRAEAIATAKAVALKLAGERAYVTSTDVLRVMRELYPHLVAGKDPRWMGAVFARGQGWKRIGWTPSGSHCRPTSMWSRS